MAKMFYTQAEAAAKLGKTPEEIKQMARDGRLREFMDNGPVYRVEDINKMASEAAGPAPSSGDAVDLELVDESSGGDSKEDTVITSAGISVFDDEDLQIEADPMAQTSITPSVEDQVSLEGTGSGSGLLDLTREADDTSLGAELLEEIYPSAPAAHVPTADVIHGTDEPTIHEPAVIGVPATIEASDPLSPAFAGMALVGLVAAAMLAVIVTAIARGVWPTFLVRLAEGNTIYMVAGGLGAGAVVFWLIGLFIGKAMSGPRA